MSREGRIDVALWGQSDRPPRPGRAQYLPGRFGEFDFVPGLIANAEVAIAPRLLHDRLRKARAALLELGFKLVKLVGEDVDADRRVSPRIVPEEVKSYIVPFHDG